MSSACWLGQNWPSLQRMKGQKVEPNLQVIQKLLTLLFLFGYSKHVWSHHKKPPFHCKEGYRCHSQPGSSKIKNTPLHQISVKQITSHKMTYRQHIQKLDMPKLLSWFASRKKEHERSRRLVVKEKGIYKHQNNVTIYNKFQQQHWLDHVVWKYTDMIQFTDSWWEELKSCCLIWIFWPLYEVILEHCTLSSNAWRNRCFTKLTLK